MLYNKILSWDIKYSTQQTQSRFWDWVKGTAFICVSAYSLCLLSGLWTTERWQSCSGQSKRPKEHSHKQWIFLSKTWRRIWWPCRDKVGFPGGSAVKNLPLNAGNLGLISGLGRSPGGGNGNHSRILAWRIPWTEGPGGLQSTGLQRVGHNWAIKHSHTGIRYNLKGKKKEIWSQLPSNAGGQGSASIQIWSSVWAGLGYEVGSLRATRKLLSFVFSSCTSQKGYDWALPFLLEEIARGRKVLISEFLLGDQCMYFYKIPFLIKCQSKTLLFGWWDSPKSSSTHKIWMLTMGQKPGKRTGFVLEREVQWVGRESEKEKEEMRQLRGRKKQCAIGTDFLDTL